MLIPYLRKSSGEDETLSFERQRRAIQAWAAANDVQLAEEVREPHVSGSKPWRDRALGEAVARVERGEADGIVVEEQNRLSRGGLKQQAELWDALERAKARLVITSAGIDTSRPGDHELSFGLNAVIARKQWREFKERSDAVKRSRIEAGIFIGPAPTGYVKGPNRTLVPDPDMAHVVRELFELRAEGKSWGDLLKHADGRTGRTWTQPGIAGIIRNRVYTGDLHYGDLVKEQAHEGLVDAPLWQAAQRRGKEPARSGRKTDKWLLSGFVVCGSCGHSMIVWRGAAQRNGRPQRLNRRYRCTNRACPARVSVDAQKIEDWTVSTLWMLIGSRVREQHDAPDLTPLLDEVERTARRLEQVSTPEAMDALGDRWAADAKARRLEHEEALAALGEARQSADETGEEVYDLRDRWDGMSVPERREALSLYAIERVIVNGRDPGAWELVMR